MKSQKINLKRIKTAFAEINNTLMDVSVKGDDVYRVSAAMKICHKLFEELSEDEPKELKNESKEESVLEGTASDS